MNRLNNICCCTARLLVLSTSMTLSLGVWANDSAVVDRDDEAPQVENIIVTAQRREENMQEVPISISAFSADAIDRMGIISPLDLQYYAPNLTIGQEPGNGFSNIIATIRGVGTINALLDPGVPMHLDGHYIQATAFFGRDLLDVERVEVLRGPQGTLYGRNAIGGSINMITKRPTDKFEGSFVADLGDYNKRLFQGVLNIPISNRVRARLAIGDENRDGYTKNVSGLGKEDLDDSDYTFIRGGLEIDLTDDVELFASAYSYDSEFGTVAFRRINAFPEFGAGADEFVQYLIDHNAQPNPTANDPFTVSIDDRSASSDEASGLSIDISWDTSVGQFQSLSSYNESETFRQGDYDFTTVMDSYIQAKIYYKTFSQEFRFVSDASRNFHWQGGAYYYKQDSTAPANGQLDGEELNMALLGIPLFLFAEDYPSTVKSYGLFGQIEYDINNSLQLVVGGRYTKDQKDQVGISGNNFSTGTDEIIFDRAEAEDEWSQFTYRAGLNFHLSDDVMLYGVYATGYRAGGLFVLSTYEPEYVNVFELGLKSELLDRRVRLNLAAFYSDYDDKQEYIQVLQDDGTFTPGGQVVNIPNTEIYGLEADFNAIVTPAFSIDASLTLQESEYNGLIIADYSAPSGQQDISGNRLPNSASVRGFVGAQYTWFVGGGNQVMFRADISYVGDQDGQIWNYPESKMPSYTRSNARLRWANPDNGWQAEVYVNNLTDEESLVGMGYWGNDPFLGNAAYGTYLPPRTVGFKLVYSY